MASNPEDWWKGLPVWSMESAEPLPAWQEQVNELPELTTRQLWPDGSCVCKASGERHWHAPRGDSITYENPAKVEHPTWTWKWPVTLPMQCVHGVAYSAPVCEECQTWVTKSMPVRYHGEGWCSVCQREHPQPPPASGPLPDPTMRAQDKTAWKKLMEDRAQELLDHESESILAILYKALYARGFRITTIDADIARALKKETGE